MQSEPIRYNHGSINQLAVTAKDDKPPQQWWGTGGIAMESRLRSRRWPITDEHRRTVIELIRKKLEKASARETSQLTRVLLQMEQQNVVDERAGVSPPPGLIADTIDRISHERISDQRNGENRFADSSQK